MATLANFLPFGRRPQTTVEVWTKQTSYELERSRRLATHRAGRNAVALILSGALGSLGGLVCDWLDMRNYQVDNAQTDAQVSICAGDIHSQHILSPATQLPGSCLSIAGRISQQREVLTYHDARTGQDTVQQDITNYVFPSSISEFISDVSIHPTDVALEEASAQRLSTEVGAGTAAVLFVGLAGSLALYARRQEFTIRTIYTRTDNVGV